MVDAGGSAHRTRDRYDHLRDGYRVRRAGAADFASFVNDLMSEIEATQNQRILHLLKMGRRLTPLAALRLLGCFRLSARIYELRAQGHAIKSGTRVLENGKHVSEYWLP